MEVGVNPAALVAPQQAAPGGPAAWRRRQLTLASRLARERVDIVVAAITTVAAAVAAAAVAAITAAAIAAAARQAGMFALELLPTSGVPWRPIRPGSPACGSDSQS